MIVFGIWKSDGKVEIVDSIKCPYCCFEYEYDGYFENLYNNNELKESCPKCNKNFKVYVEFPPVYSDSYKVPCWNGESCEYKQLNGYPNGKICKNCGDVKLEKLMEL